MYNGNFKVFPLLSALRKSPRGGGNFNRWVTGVCHLTCEDEPLNFSIFVKTIPQNLQAIEDVYHRILTAIQNVNQVSEI